MTKNPLYYSRLTLLMAWSILASLIQCLRFLPFGKKTSNDSDYIRFLVPPGRAILGLRYVIKQPEKLPTGPCVYVMNHQSALDLFSNTEVYPRHCIVIVKKTLTRVPIFGWLLALGDNICLDRSNRAQSVNQLSVARDKMLEKQVSVWIFPEGTRRKTGAIHPFKRGAFHLSIQAGVPVVPIVVSSYLPLDFGQWRSGTVIVEELPAIETEGYNSDNLDDLIETCHTLMAKTFETNSEEAKQATESDRLYAAETEPA